MNRTPQADLDRLYFELPIMRGEREATCRELGIAPGTLWRRLDRLRKEGLAVFIGTGWLPTSDSWIEEDMMGWTVLGRHKWVDGCTISESIQADDDQMRRFTATIYGYHNWRIWQGRVTAKSWPHVLATIMAKVVAIRVRIAECDDSVFEEPQAW